MMTGRHVLAIHLAIAWCLSGGPARAEPRTVVELFTSQGCSSCVAADHLLERLRLDPHLLVVSLHVTYWDYLGWKDTFGDPRHDTRQAAYARSRGERGVYTPNLVVGGVVHVAGSDEAELRSTIARSRDRTGGIAVPLAVSTTDDRVTVRAEAQPRSEAGEVWLLGITSSAAVSVGRGENRGRKMTYTNVVRRWVKLGDWTGEARTWTLPLEDVQVAGIDALVAIVQDGTAARPGAIVGASLVKLN